MRIIACLLAVLSAGTQALAEEVPARPFFLPQRIVQADMSPDGQIVLMETNEKGQTLIEAILPGSRTSYALKSLGEAEIGYFTWLGARHFLFIVYVPEEDRSYYVMARLEVEQGAITGADFQLFKAHGDLIDALPGDDEFMLFYQDKRVYRYPLTQRGIQGKGFTKKFMADVKLPAEGSVLTDASHQIRFLIGEEEAALPGDGIQSKPGSDAQVHTFWYLPQDGSEWREVARMDAEYLYALVGFAPNQRDVIMISDHGRDTRALMRFNPETGTFTETLFDVHRADVIGAVVDPAGELVSARYVRSGAVRQHHFKTANEEQTRNIRAAISDQHNTVFIDETSLDGRFHLARVYGATEEGRYLHYDASTQVALDLGTNRPWLEGMTTADVRVINAASADGVALEGYLTMPAKMADGGKVPMVVKPHGGPMGIRATTGFDSEAQFLAANGIAVLEVNFRGSGGFGRRFTELGKGEYGKGIEDDIETLVDAAIAGHSVDARRICAFGSSYGGYSSLMLGLRNPGRYRCSAAFAAPTDTQLLFSASDWMFDVNALEGAVEWYGNPERDAEMMHSRSPAYLAEQFQTPLFLAQGLEDFRVDVEHYHRLTLMLDHFGKTYEGLLLPDTGHGFDDVDTEAMVYDRLLAFLLRHL